MPKPLPITCGTLVTDGTRLLLGHATGSPRWDIPKGLLETNEHPRQAAVRELAEETGLLVPPPELIDLGLHAYLPRKTLALFCWRVAVMPDPAGLVCRSSFIDRRGRSVPEFDRFIVVDWPEARGKVGPSLAAVLERLGSSAAVSADGAQVPSARGADRSDDSASADGALRSPPEHGRRTVR